MYPEVFRALPIRKAEILKLPRQYLINVIHTIVGEPFAQWVKQRVDARHKKVADDQEMHVEMDEEILAIY